MARIGGRFARSEARENAKGYLQGLFGTLSCKNCWQLSEAMGAESPYRFQHLLGRAKWDANRVRDDLRSYVLAHLADAKGVLILDDTGFIKGGQQSVGVQRQYTGTSGQIDNCQIGVFLMYATRQSATFIDRELYLPKVWADDDERRQPAHVPSEVVATKVQLGQRMLERAFAAGVRVAWVTADELYAIDHGLRRWLEARNQAYVFAIPRHERVWVDRMPCRVDELAASWPAEEWQRLSCGKGSKGPREYEWIRMRVNGGAVGWSRHVLVRRRMDAPDELDYYSVYAPDGTRLESMVRAAGCRWKIETGFEDGKGAVGLDEYEVRTWTGWYRHITLAMCAHAVLNVIRVRAAQVEGNQRRNLIARSQVQLSPSVTPCLPWTILEVRRLLWQLVWQQMPSVQHVLSWSRWRRQHQAIAQIYHYRRHQAARQRETIEAARQRETVERQE
jgi:SRSO17 transposase